MIALTETYLSILIFTFRVSFTDFEEAIEKVKQEDLKIPFGVGIVGYVAQNKEIINIKDAYNVSVWDTFWLLLRVETFRPNSFTSNSNQVRKFELVTLFR